MTPISTSTDASVDSPRATRSTPSHPIASSIATSGDGFVNRDGGRFYRIVQHDHLPPFLMTIVSPSDHWLFVASNGGLTAGRVNAERALFPYLTVDRIYDSAGTTGPFTCMLVATGGSSHLWEPLQATGRQFHRLTRNLYKSVEGNRLIFEEINHDLGLTFSAEWTTSDRFGFVRRARLINDGETEVAVRMVDGLRNLLPAGIPRRLQDAMSCLADAYKRSELLAGTRLGIYALSAGITDQPVALESLVATTVWSEGLPESRVLLTERQLESFRTGSMPAEETGSRGVRGLYAVASEFRLNPGGRQEWYIVADTGRSQSDVVELGGIIRHGSAGALLEASVAAGTRQLRAIVGGADGLQSGGDETATTHHFANVLFNAMRGGVFLHGYEIESENFADFVAERNRTTSRRLAAWFKTLPETLTCAGLGRSVSERNDADLQRLFLEYLPLGFSRRHGDPSRPWNHFAIRLRDDTGREVLEYEGNWRDIFQNWEALGTSFPGFLEHMVAKFVNATTLDGNNPYRITRRGIEWETPAPDDPWAGIGYWGDHQIIYLLKLLEWAEHIAPGRFHQWIERAVFSYAAVPYRIVSYDEMRRNPRETIEFIAAEDAAIREREATEGTDARLVRGPDGAVRHVTLAEKLILTALARLANLIPGGGIWMNTQRPEWNDANNALVGFGVSGVTLCHLRRYLHFCRRLLADLAARDVVLSAAVARFINDISLALPGGDTDAAAAITDPVTRRATVDRLSGAGSRHRAWVYANGPGEPAKVSGSTILALLDAAIPFVEANIRALRRPDGLFHAYRLLHFPDDRTLTLDDLPLMLEGQVAVLGSGQLEPAEAVNLLRALRASPLYRTDRNSYLLYPDGNPPGFLERNIVSGELLRRTPVLDALLEAGNTRLVRRDARGDVRFHHDLINAAALESRLAELLDDPRWSSRISNDATGIRTAYEEVFAHRAFTGRSGAMFAYEGLGSVYWHMISKLLLATQEAHAHALERDEPTAAAALSKAYFEIRSGLGFQQSAAAWGAFPTDPYSHTPGHAGAQQPGMTGQVKEGILARLGELGVTISDGRVRFDPHLLRAGEFVTTARDFSWFNAIGEESRTSLPPDSLAFTLCGVLVVYTLGQGNELTASTTSCTGATTRLTTPVLPADLASKVFQRSSALEQINVVVGAQRLARTRSHLNSA